MKVARKNRNGRSNKPLESPYIEPMTRALQSLAIDGTYDQSKHTCVPEMIRSPQKNSHKPSYLQDKGLTCLIAQLGRVDTKIRYNNSLKQLLIDYEEEYKRELAASLAKSMVGNSEKSKDKGLWVKYFDNEVGAEYFYNTLTGEASWVDPDAA
ncbi:hypothetical protein ACHAWO_012959 [Cyclotella atomus]|uniref:WW domain-containing protein n=1 Tax=Cyclotella atomus TaxID=382360 RepID=A0ABD3PQU7_9STRA